MLRVPTLSRSVVFGLGCWLCLPFASPAVWGAGSDDSKELFTKAQSVVARVLPNAYLVYIGGTLSNLGGCKDDVNWQFFFQSDAATFAEGRPVGAVIEYNPRLHMSGTCPLLERIVVDTALAPMMGYRYLATHQNLDEVNIGWQEASQNAVQKYPGFVWARTFKILSPLYPSLSEHVFYVLPGTEDGHDIKVFVDAGTGDVTAG